MRKNYVCPEEGDIDPVDETPPPPPPKEDEG